MNLQKKSILLVFLILLIPSSIFALDVIKTGYDLYQNIKLFDNEKNTEEVVQGMYTTGFLKGYIDGIVIMQDIMYDMVFPPKVLSKKEIEEASKKLNVYRLNIPKEGLPFGQIVLIYKRYAEKHPEKLNESAGLCIFLSLIDAYGWKK